MLRWLQGNLKSDHTIEMMNRTFWDPLEDEDLVNDK